MTVSGILAKSVLVWAVATSMAVAVEDFTFPSIDGGEYRFSDWRGQPILVVNTASQCGFTPQYEGLQALHDRYADQGLIVLAVPSDDFGQELANEAQVAEFCELNYNLTLPMTEITRIKAPDAHPFFEWLAREHNARPSWNFSKFLIDGNGEFVEDWSSLTGPTSGAIIRAVERELAR